MTFLTLAHDLLERGFSIIPLRPRDKAPILGVTNRTRDPKIVAEWGSRFPDANVGVCADEDIVILDADDAAGMVAKTGGMNTFTVESSAGKAHYYFRRDGFKIRNLELGKLGSLRADNMYVVGPGSIHPKTGEPYRIVNDAPVATLQRGLYRELECLAEEADREVTRITADWDGMSKIPEGMRQYFLRSQAGRLWDGEKSEEEMFAALQGLNEKYCDPPKPEGKVAALVQWVMQKEPNLAGIRVTVGSSGEVKELQGPDGINLTEMGNAERVLLAHKEDILWVSGGGSNSAGMFFVWSGQRWEEDTVAAVPGMVKSTMRGLSRLVKLAVDQRLGGKEVERVLNFWRASEQEYMIRDVVKLIRSDVAVDRGRFDADPLFFNVQNGTLDLKTGEFRAADRTD